jgi:hypothetical protein
MGFRQQARIEALANRAPDHVRLFELTRVEERRRSFPVYGLVLGSSKMARPTFGLFGGVHGLERVGTEIALTFLESLIARLEWDKDARRLLRKCRIVSIPMVNPAGIFYLHRHNHRGIDLMRNAPVDADVKTPFLVGGHRLSRRLPWYRGEGGLEPEARALVDFVKEQMFGASALVSLDIHSGFGWRDRLWYPYARTDRPFPAIGQVRALVDLLERSLPYHVYRVEPQSDNYCTHGDLWDYLFDEHLRIHGHSKPFLPWTLEIGSWTWVKKNPIQLFRIDGPFNPIKPHRHSRTMRRHLALLEFFWRVARNYRRWSPTVETSAGLDAPIA